MDKKNLKWFLPVLSGLLLVLSQPPFSVALLPFFSLLPLFFFLKFEDVSFKKSFFAGLVAGFIFLGGTLSWFFNALPLYWLNIENNFLGSFVLSFCWILLILVLASFVGFFSLSYSFLKRKKYWDILLIPSLWIVFEYLRALAFGILYFGEESLLGAHWTFSNLAYALAQNQSFRFLASIGGIYLISFLVVFINVLFFVLISRFKKTRFILFVLIVMLICFSYVFSFSQDSKEDGQGLKIAVLQTKFPTASFRDKEVSAERLQTQTNLVDDAFRSVPDLDVIVFPEGSRFLSQEGAEKLLAEISEKEFLVIDSENSTAILYQPQKGTLAEYEKLLLVPVGDYLPYFFEYPARLINKQWVEEIAEPRGHQKGEKMFLLADQKFFYGGTLFCAEAVSPLLHRQIVQEGAQILLNLGSLAFAHGSLTLDSQTQAMLQLRAAESGRYLVRATNFGTSYIINQRGKIIKKTPNLENQVIFSEIQVFSQKTFYIRYGDWILILALVVILTSILNSCIMRK